MVQRFGTPSFLKNHQTPTSPPQTPPSAAAAKMNSPLPDSSALEAGILEDARPTRLSRVQDNVRNLLRSSVFGSVKSSPPTTPTRDGPPAAPSRPHFELPPTPVSLPREIRREDLLPCPASTVSSDSSPPGSPTTHYTEGARGLGPDGYADGARQTTHQSGMFNSRAIAALNHPDLSDPSLESLTLQKAQHGQRRGRNRSGKKSRKGRKGNRARYGSRGLICLLASLLLGALVAAYVCIATTQSGLTLTFHILFVLGICLATVLFAHSVTRLLFIGRSSHNRPLFVAVPHQGQRRRHGHHHTHNRRHLETRQMPNLTGEPDFVPPTPIPVRLASDDVREDVHVAQPSLGAQRSADSWDKDVPTVLNPPPAYGRWRGSVRANPDLLHWQVVRSRVTPDATALPSPTYEEAMAAIAHNEAPPSYVTRESPARQREMQQARAGFVPLQAVEPEMFEVRGPGVGLAL